MRRRLRFLASLAVFSACAPGLSAEPATQGNLNDFLADGFQIVSTVGTPSNNGFELIVIVQKEQSAAFCQVGLLNVTETETSNPVYLSGPWNNSFLCLPLVNGAYEGVVPEGQFQPNTVQEDKG